MDIHFTNNFTGQIFQLQMVCCHCYHCVLPLCAHTVEMSQPRVGRHKLKYSNKALRGIACITTSCHPYSLSCSTAYDCMWNKSCLKLQNGVWGWHAIARNLFTCTVISCNQTAFFFSWGACCSRLILVYRGYSGGVTHQIQCHFQWNVVLPTIFENRKLIFLQR